VADDPKRIHGLKLIDALLDSGIIRRDDFVRRLVIDIPYDGAVVLHVERIGDSRLLAVVPTLAGVEIRETPAP